jgi:peptidyl-prolyl cis-trans isomerase SurA
MGYPSCVRRFALILALAVPSALLAAAAEGAPAAKNRAALDKIVAVVDSEVILMSELRRATDRHPLLLEAIAQLPANATEGQREEKRQQVEGRVLDELIDLALIRAEAERFEIGVTEDDVDRALPNFAAQYGLTVQELRKQVEASGEYESWAEYRADVKDQILQYKVPQYLATWSVSDAQVREHYRKLTRDELAKVEVLQFTFTASSQESEDRDRAFARAQIVARRLRAGEEPTAVAESVGYGRDLDRTIGRGDIAPSLEDAVFAAKEGGVVGPIGSGQGYVVFKIVRHQASAALGFDQAKDRIREQLEQEAFFKAEQEMRRKLRAKAHIDIRL